MEAKHWALHRLTKIFSPPGRVLDSLQPPGELRAAMGQEQPQLGISPPPRKKAPKIFPQNTPPIFPDERRHLSMCPPGEWGGGLMNN